MLFHSSTKISRRIATKNILPGGVFFTFFSFAEMRGISVHIDDGSLLCFICQKGDFSVDAVSICRDKQIRFAGRGIGSLPHAQS